MGETGKTFAIGAAVILLAAAAAHGPALRGGFLWDDGTSITENPMIHAGDGLRRFWFTTEASDYYPLTSTLWWLEWRWWGNDPLGYRVVNLLLHGVNAVLLWLLLSRLGIAGAWLAALIFAVHPVNVATVAWISEQKNTLSLALSTVAALLYLRFDETRRWPTYAASLVTFLLAALSKSAVVMLPAVLLACVWWRRGRLQRRGLLCLTPFFALSLALGLVTVWFQTHRALEGTIIRADNFVTRLATAGWVPWFYLFKALLPLNLTVIYPKWRVNAGQWISWVPGLALAGCFVLFWLRRASWGRACLLGLGCFVAMLFPVLGFFDQGFYQYSLVADHWQYHAIIAVIALAVAAVGLVVRGTGPIGQYALATAVVLVLGIGTWRRSVLYADEETLWRDNIARNPTGWGPYYNLGVLHWTKGDLDGAMRFYERAIQLSPESPQSHYNFAMGLLRLGRLAEATEHWRQVLRVKPAYRPAQYNLGVALLHLGHTQEALDHLKQALRLDPSNAETHNALATALLQLGRADEAIQHWERAAALQPDNANTHYKLGLVFYRQNRVQEAIRHWEQTLRINPGHAEAHARLGNAWMQLDRMPDAIRQYEQAVRLNPNFAEAHNNLGAALIKQGQVEAAIGHFQQALRLRPEYAKAHYNLASALEKLGRIEEAVTHYQQALRIQPDLVEAHKDLERLDALGPSNEDEKGVPDWPGRP